MSAPESVSMGTVDALVASLPPSDYRLIEIAGIIIVIAIKRLGLVLRNSTEGTYFTAI